MSRPNLRQRPRISYYEPEEPSLDEYIFCDECADFVYEYCAIHGPLLVIPDDKVPSKSPFPAFVPRAALTIPHVFLHLAPSIIPGAGLGVFSTLTLPRGVRFGPYCGVRTQEVDSMYCWQIYDRNHKRSHVIDAADGDRSNWMRYVNCARNWREQNLLAYQYQGQLYYRTIKIIPRFTELMVFYGSEFANTLHINLSKYNSPPGYAQKFGAPAAKKPKLDIQKEKNVKSTSSKHIKKINNNGRTKKNVFSKIRKTEKVVPYNSNSTIHTTVNNHSIYNEENIEITKSKENIEITKTKENIDITKTKQNIEITNSTENTETLQYNNVSKDDFKCEMCNYIAIGDSDMKRHIMAKHKNSSGKDRPYKCDKCPTSFARKGNLIMHIRTHTGEKPFKCNMCPTSFAQKGNLLYHSRTHTGEKPYKCNTCAKSFADKGHLTRHIRTHTGEKPFKCNMCPKSFAQEVVLKYHIRTHTGEKPFKCNMCPTSFAQKGSLLYHSRTHTGEKPYKCHKCSKSFAQKGNLISHIRTHTGEKPYKCDICLKSFSKSRTLRRHILTHAKV